ncbi:helix-turn-helix domain-containing protein [Siccirubricoccus sp. G192]|uniref:helix-turn-helix domain-containing protein n=1 Tax=Siccirubricoccus sp. G192 TaxID=2849651 RepID=UPI001C2B8A1E|nr:helix-turn-helix domain-containing protein [Siccirubricoccus sp. G192]MBV1798920.1 helix-turn-helix domain-containing protein [Siccirubricoccus sp. G192]
MAVEAVPVHPGPFTGSVSSIDLDGATLEIVRSDPVLLLGTAAEDRSGFLLMLGETRQARWNGASISEGQVALFGNGLPVAVASPGSFACAFVSSAGAERQGILPAGWDQAWRDLPDPIRHVDAQAHARLALLAEAAERAAFPAPACPGRTEGLRAERATLRDAVRTLFVPPGEAVPRRRGRPPSRVQIVREADDYLQANPARPIYTDELCTALGVSASCLHAAFEATFGLSPHRFLKLRRMAMVRTMLLSGSGPWHSVKAAALSHGFWHLGQFAHDYRALFGESPSETLARSR